MVLDEGVVQGRATFCNMLKYICMTASSNFGNVFPVLVASAFLPMGPLAPAFKLQALPAATMAGYVLLATLMKRVHVARCGWL